MLPHIKTPVVLCYRFRLIDDTNLMYKQTISALFPSKKWQQIISTVYVFETEKMRGISYVQEKSMKY